MLNSNYAKQHLRQNTEKTKGTHSRKNPSLTPELQARWNKAWEKLSSAENEAGDYFSKFFNDAKGSKYLCLFGAAKSGEYHKQALTDMGLSVSFFCDNDSKKWGTDISGVKCISPEELLEHKNDTAIGITSQFFPDCFRQLTAMGFEKVYRLNQQLMPSENCKLRQFIIKHKQDYCRALTLWADEKSTFCYIKRFEALQSIQLSGFWEEIQTDLHRQYFEPELYKSNSQEVFVDVGAFDGDTLLSFIKYTQGQFKAAYEFEVDSNNFNKLTNVINGLPAELSRKIVAVPKGLYNKKSIISLESQGIYTSVNYANNEEFAASAQIVPLDDEIRETVSFIKMDIEGAEMAALQGAAETIKKDRPLMAISIYHKLEDMWELPEYILSLYPEYKLYLRHYTNFPADTVCYAIPPERVKK